jgi:hypothetical protein
MRVSGFTSRWTPPWHRPAAADDRLGSERLFVALTFAAYLALTLWLALHHEVWSDESDPWLLMRDGGLRVLLEQTGYGHRGTPALWFLAIWPFAASGATVLAQQLLNVAFAAGAILLFLLHAPFGRMPRVLFAFGYVASFEYAVISRPYSAMMMLLFAAAALWQKRTERPVAFAVVVALLANTTVHGLILGGFFGLISLVEAWTGAGRRRFLSLAIMLAGGLAAAAQLLPRAAGQESLYRVELDTVWYALAAALFPEARTSTALLPAIVIFALVAFAVRRSLPAQVILWGATTALMLVFTFVWVGGHRHTGILLLVVLVSLWMARVDGRQGIGRAAMIGLSVALGWSVLFAARAWRDESRLAFSGSREAAQYIRTNLERVPIAAHRPMACSPILAYGRSSFYYPGRGESGSYMRWDRKFQLEQDVPVREAVARANRELGGDRWVLLLNSEMPADLAADYRLLYRTQQPVWGKAAERFWFYELRNRRTGGLVTDRIDAVRRE